MYIVETSRRLASALSLAAVLLATVWASPAHATNCNGSTRCQGREGSVAADIGSFILENIDPNFYFLANEQVACKGVSGGYICAFVQGTAGAYGFEIQQVVMNISRHGCRVCGSTALNGGELTINFTTHACLDRGGIFHCR